MKRGFTILELLVASMLLGMLTTILTMIFNQSSIAWRTGVAGIVDMDMVRDNIAAVRDEADNIYLWDGEIHRTLSLWNESAGGNRPVLRKRAIDVDGAGVDQREKVNAMKDQSKLQVDRPELKDIFGLKDMKRGEVEAGRTWIVNIKSNGPNGIPDDYDDIWSVPDDFE